MKTKREIIERPNAMIQNRSTRPEFYQNEVENFMDEYAEEYAKAFLNWYLFGIGINDKDNGNLDHELLAQFKESLNK
jgi:hypothetical protein